MAKYYVYAKPEGILKKIWQNIIDMLNQMHSEIYGKHIVILKQKAF